MHESDNDKKLSYGKNMLAADIIFGGLQLSRKMRLLFGLTAKKIGSTASDGGLRAGLAA